ncbi:hypothetical protein PR048_032505 [Dryococelus australis]|uniref:Uncharacterized protein n=1 Tax=Dryococelus australis TaxID=614101 RepID=A0ABQ9G2E9_9NEOP|nr:hypothetical protein PR048_032505 [Dryococelus australis]
MDCKLADMRCTVENTNLNLSGTTTKGFRGGGVTRRWLADSQVTSGGQFAIREPSILVRSARRRTRYSRCPKRKMRTRPSIPRQIDIAVTIKFKVEHLAHGSAFFRVRGQEATGAIRTILPRASSAPSPLSARLSTGVQCSRCAAAPTLLFNWWKVCRKVWRLDPEHSDKGDSNTRAQRHVAPTRKALNLRAMLPLLDSTIVCTNMPMSTVHKLSAIAVEGGDWDGVLQVSNPNIVWTSDTGSIPGRVTPDFRMWESCRTMPLVGGFSRGSPVSPVLSFWRHSIFTSITLIGSQDIALDYSPPTKAGSLPDSRMWESCRAMPLVGGVSRESPVTAFSFWRCFVLTSPHPHRLSIPRC